MKFLVKWRNTTGWQKYKNIFKKISLPNELFLEGFSIVFLFLNFQLNFCRPSTKFPNLGFFLRLRLIFFHANYDFVAFYFFRLVKKKMKWISKKKINRSNPMKFLQKIPSSPRWTQKFSLKLPTFIFLKFVISFLIFMHDVILEFLLSINFKFELHKLQINQ